MSGNMRCDGGRRELTRSIYQTIAAYHIVPEVVVVDLELGKESLKGSQVARTDAKLRSHLQHLTYAVIMSCRMSISVCTCKQQLLLIRLR